ncbi:hypothetical protein FJ365_01795 [Candidatus Dependentiae bacterium]|nr:hypothetical protein [Candidatus Dependentiae bacterium]
MLLNRLNFLYWVVKIALLLMPQISIQLNASIELGYADAYCHQWYPSIPRPLMVLIESPTSSQRPFLFSCPEKNALLAALDELLMVRINLFMNTRQMQSINPAMNKYTKFDDIVSLYHLLMKVNALPDHRVLETSAILKEVPFEELLTRIPYIAVKEALIFLQQGNPIYLIRLLDKNNHAYCESEIRSALAASLVMLISACKMVVDVRVKIRGIPTCINLIQIYEHVEQLPIENLLQAMHMLLHRIGIMLDSLSQKEEGFVDWLKNKWVYLPVTVLIVAMRIAKYYWGNHDMFNSYTVGNQWNNATQFSNDSSFGIHNLLFETHIKEGRSNFKNDEVVVGSA